MDVGARTHVFRSPRTAALATESTGTQPMDALIIQGGRKLAGRATVLRRAGYDPVWKDWQRS